jgi:hypothetical protein
LQNNLANFINDWHHILKLHLVCNLEWTPCFLLACLWKFGTYNNIMQQQSSSVCAIPLNNLCCHCVVLLQRQKDKKETNASSWRN